MNKKLKVAILDSYIPDFQKYSDFLEIIYFQKFAKMKEFMSKYATQGSSVIGLLSPAWKNLNIEKKHFITFDNLKEAEEHLLKIYNQITTNQQSIPNKRLEILRRFKGIAKPNIEISEDEWYLQ